MTKASTINPGKGFVFGASGKLHVTLAVGAARSVKRAHPGAAVDLFGQIEEGDLPEDHPFDQIHPLRDIDTRPKFEALLYSRFERTIYLDNDIRMVAPVEDVFDVLTRFDLAVAHEPLRNMPQANVLSGDKIPAAFPQLQGGVIGRSGSAEAGDFIARWREGFRGDPGGVDQPSLRALAWQDTALRLAILPPEYNFWDSWSLVGKRPTHSAPRILHSRRLKSEASLAAAAQHTDFSASLEDPVLPLLLGSLRFALLKALLTEDRTLNETLDPNRSPTRFHGPQLRAILSAGMRELPNLLSQMLRKDRLS